MKIACLAVLAAGCAASLAVAQPNSPAINNNNGPGSLPSSGSNSGGSGLNLVLNGGFELGPNPGSTFTTHLAPSTAITHWTVLSGSVDHVNSFWKAGEGNRSLDLSGRTAGSISQTIATTAGAWYRLEFLMAGNPNMEPIKSLRVDAGDRSQTFSFDISGKSLTGMGWTLRSMDFRAIASTTALTFVSLNNSKWGAALDGVRAFELPASPAVPAPGALALAGITILAARRRRS